ncbi:MAG: phosphate ABC transporter permease PstA [Candidatus Delongbacteria bacterium]|nr:phosphate ABC transporter permease PstA [Candidatus Delongbacteria bacterium]
MQRKSEEKIALWVMRGATALVLIFLALILGSIIMKGLPHLNWAMLSQTPKGGYYLGKSGGILNAIIGSLILAGGAVGLALVFSLPIALYLNVFLRNNHPYQYTIRFCLDVMNGIPSIIYGALGLILMYYFNLRASLLAGILTVALLIYPVMCRAMDELLQNIPEQLKETAYALGSTRYELAWRIMIRQAAPGMITAILVALGRGIGDAASVLFTAGFSDRIPISLMQPVATLPLAIFFQLTSPIVEVQNRAYAAAMILTLIILSISLISRQLIKRIDRYTVK